MPTPELELPPQLPHVTTMPVGYGWVVLCSEHGALGPPWSTPAGASFGAMGHAAAHHAG